GGGGRRDRRRRSVRGRRRGCALPRRLRARLRGRAGPAGGRPGRAAARGRGGKRARGPVRRAGAVALRRPVSRPPAAGAAAGPATRSRLLANGGARLGGRFAAGARVARDLALEARRAGSATRWDAARPCVWRARALAARAALPREGPVVDPAGGA